MRIIHILKHCRHQNGNAHVAVDLACVQAAQGDEVVFASAGGNMESILESHGVRVQRTILDRQSIKNMAFELYKFIRFCQKFKPDVIHAHMMSAALFGFVASKVTGVPLVTTVHNSFDKHATLMKLGKKVVAVSEAERKLLLELGFKPRQLEVVLNGTTGSPLDEFGDPCGVMLPPNSVLTVCGLHRRKGVHDIIEAIRLLGEDFAGWQFYIGGSGPDEEKLKELVISAGLEGSIKFLGALSRPKPVMRQAQIFILASYAEPCGLVLSEARVAGCAMIATNIGGISENLEYGKAGLLVDAGAPEQMAAAIRTIILDPGALARWRAAAAANVDKYSVERVVEDYRRVYKTLMS